MDLEDLSDEALMAQVECLARSERFTLVDFLIHLGELDRRDACERKGHPSVFAYLTKRLGYAECDAMRRVRAARAARRFPSILRMIGRGELHLVGVAMLQPFLDSENYRRLLGQARGKSQREIERMVARLSPEAIEPRDRIRILPPPAAAVPAEGGERAFLELEPVGQASAALEPAAPLESCEAGVPQRRVFTFSAGEEVERLFLQARDLLRHRFPQGRMEEIMGEAFKRLIDSEVPRGPRRASENAGSQSRRILGRVRHEVWQRDGGQCAYRAADGARCPETGWLEYDHIVPWARGGRSDDAANIRLLCRAHNQSEARRLLGGAKGDFGGDVRR